MRRLPIIYVLLAWLLMLLVAACGSEPPPAASPSNEATPTESADSEATAAQNLAEFDPAQFDNSTTIDNEWLPLRPGARFVYEGTTVEDDGTVVPHRIEINVTDLTKLIGGVRAVVTWDLDYSDNELVEAELAFFAQDKDGNVWRMGEYPEEYDAGQIVASPTWIHGFADARAGIEMQAKPQLGTPSYSQGWGPAVGWTDRGQVDQMGQQTCVPVDCYTDVLVIAETSQAEAKAGAFQLKYFARGVGNIRVGWRGEGEKTQEVLELVTYEQLSPEALAEVRAKALDLEQSAYAHSKDVYAQTAPISAPEGVAQPAATTSSDTAAESPADAPVAPAAEVVVYVADLPESALAELEFSDDPASPGGKLLGLPNNGDELDAPPEDDPHVTFPVAVQEGVAYRCWIHMKVGAPKGKSQANVLWVQFSDVVDEAGNVILEPGTASYLTAQGPTQEGWTWVECTGEAAPSLVSFGSSEVTVRIQAGMEGVSFDQFLLSSAQFLENPPAEAIVQK